MYLRACFIKSLDGDDVTLYIVGKIYKYVGGFVDCEFCGVFESEQLAVAACKTDQYFVGPAELNERLPDNRKTWAGCYYPLAEKVEADA